MPKITGVYKVLNNITGDFYIGSSVDIRSRFSNHMNRDARKYQGKHHFYDDVFYYGKENFKLIILEECERDYLIELEQCYYDNLQPTYNKVRPAYCNFEHEEVKLKANRNSNTEEHVAKRKELYNSPEYKEYFRTVHIDKMRPVEMIKDGVVLNEFISMQEASRFISEHTNFKGKNKTSKIKMVCDGERKSAYGYYWKYKNV